MIADGNVQEVEVGQELTIGRAYTNLLRLEGEEVSRVHAILYKRDQDYLIRDLDSKNGVYLNGQRVTSSIVVPGDEIQIGNYILLFDPPEDFDLAAFLKQRSLEPPDEKKKQSEVKIAAPARAKVHDEETDDRFETSIHFVPQSLPQVFYDISEIEELSQTDALPLSGMFTTELVRALRALTASGDSVSESERLQRVLEAVTAATHADRGVLVLRDAGSDALRLGAIWPRERDVSVTRVVLRAVLRERQAVLCNDAQSDPRFQQTETVQRENIASMLAYPLLAKNQVLGLIYVDTQGRPNAFRREQLIILQFLAKICVMMLGASEAQQK